MNEKLKRIGIIGTFLLLVALLVIQSITDHKTVRRADTTIDILTRELDDAQRRLNDNREEIRDCRNTIIECRNGVRQVNNGLERETERVSDIIENLKTIRTEIENMENAINKFYGKYGGDDDYNYNNGSEIE